MPVRLVGTTFDGATKDTNFWTETVTGTGSVTQDGEVILSIGTTAGTVLKYSAGILRVLNISGVLNNSVITLYDNTAASGTIIWSSGAMSAQTQPFSLEFNETSFDNGLTLEITSANSNITVVYE